MQNLFGADKCRLQEQIMLQTDTIDRLDHRIGALESKLQSPQLPDEQRARLEQELDNVKELLTRSRSMLSDYKVNLQRRQKPILLVASLVFGCFLLYSLYVLWFGP